MQTQTHTLNAPDGAKLHYYAWLPETAPKAVLLIVHGYGEHAGRYAHVAEQLVEDGFAVYGIDHRGHGKSDGERVFFNSMEQPVEDLRHFHSQLKKKHEGLAFYMFGHSMGSIISLMYALHYQDDLKALVISGTATNAEETSNPVMVSVGQLVATVSPKTRLLPSLPASVLSTDEEMVKRYDADPLNDRGSMRIGIASQMIQSGRMIRANAKKLTLPLLILHGEEDQLTPISGSRAIHASASSPDKTLITYPTMRHEVVNERDRQRVIGDIRTWLSKH